MTNPNPARRKNIKPGLSVPSGITPEMAKFLQGVKEHLQGADGTRGQPLERFVTLQDLKDVGLINTGVKNGRGVITELLLGDDDDDGTDEGLEFDETGARNNDGLRYHAASGSWRATDQVALLDRGPQEWTGSPNLFGLTASQIAAFPLDISGSSDNPTSVICELGAHGTFDIEQAPTFYGARINTSLAAPSAVLSGNSMFSLRAFGYDGDELALAGQVFIQAAEDFSETNRGSNFRVDLVPIGSATIARAFVVQALSSGGFAIHGEEPVTVASEPTFSWRLDPDTGIGRTGTTNEIALLTAGTIKAVLTSAGRLIIGHTAALTVAGLTNPFQTISTGSVGWTAARFSADAVGPVAGFGKSRGATIGAYDAVVAGDNLGQFNFGGSDGSDLNNVAGTFGVEVDAGTVAANQVPGRFFFQTADAAGALRTALQLNSSQQALLELNSAALPSVSFRQDPDTGIYRYATNGIGFAGAGQHRVGIDGSGRLLVGGPAYTAINSGGAQLGVQNIGTSIGTTGFGTAIFSNDTVFSRINFLKSRATAPASFAIVQAGDTLGSLRWSADDGVDYQTDVVAQNVVIDGSPAANAVSGYWQLAINAGTSATSELVRAGRYSNSGNEAYFRLTGNSNDTGTIDRTSAGFELLAVTVAADGLFPLIKWMSSDASLTSNNPRMVAFIGVRSTEAYDADTDAGARIVFGSNAVAAGTGDPAIYAFMSPAEFEFNTTLFDINAAVDVSGNVVVGGDIVLTGSLFGPDTTSGLSIAGGNTAGNGANIELYGGSHATVPNQGFIDATTLSIRTQDAATTVAVFSTTEARLSAAVLNFDGPIDLDSTDATVAVFTGTNAGGTNLRLQGSTFARFTMEDTGSGADLKIFALVNSANTLSIRAYDDGFSTNSIAIEITKDSSQAITEMRLAATVLNLDGELDINPTAAVGATGGADTLPANPVGFIVVTIAGTSRKIPYYAT